MQTIFFENVDVNVKLFACYGASIYAVMELLALWRWRNRVLWVNDFPLPGLGKDFPLKKYENYFEKTMELQKRPKDVIESLFQAPLHRISSERALHFLCFYLTMKEQESFALSRYPDEIISKATRILDKMQTKGGFVLHSNPATAWLPWTVRSESTLPRSNTVDFARIGRASIDAFYKPIPLRLLMLLARSYAENEMRQMGFVRTVGLHNIVYWKRPQQTKRDDSRAIRPLFFLHGLGFGIVPYVHFIRSLLDDRRDIVVPEWPNISLGWSDNRNDKVPIPVEYADSLFKVIRTLKNSDGSMATCIDTIAHSWGTIVTAYYMAHRPSLLVRRVYIDALTFGASFHRFIAFSFEYCLRSWSELLAIRRHVGIFETFAMWFVKGDINVQLLGKRGVYLAHVLSSDMNQVLDHNCLFVLGGNDPVIPSYDVADHVLEQKLQCKVLIDDDWAHGGFLHQSDPNNYWQRIADWVSPREKGSLRRVKSDPSFRGHLLGSAT